MGVLHDPPDEMKEANPDELTLRRYVAIEAMKGLIATGNIPAGGASELAMVAWNIADAMLQRE